MKARGSARVHTPLAGFPCGRVSQLIENGPCRRAQGKHCFVSTTEHPPIGVLSTSIDQIQAIFKPCCYFSDHIEHFFQLYKTRFMSYALSFLHINTYYDILLPKKRRKIPRKT
jgi:hypothetical protein